MPGLRSRFCLFVRIGLGVLEAKRKPKGAIATTTQLLNTGKRKQLSDVHNSFPFHFKIKCLCVDASLSV